MPLISGAFRPKSAVPAQWRSPEKVGSGGEQLAEFVGRPSETRMDAWGLTDGGGTRGIGRGRQSALRVSSVIDFGGLLNPP